MPNPWDVGSAKLLASLGFEALATTSSGFAGTLGKLDGQATRDEVMAHAAALVAAVDVPVSADLENGFVDDPVDVAETARRAVGAALAGFSIEDYARDAGAIYDAGLAAERVAAAAEVAHAGPVHVVLTARCENLIRGVDDLGDTIDRLRRYRAAGADVLFAPGLRAIDDIRRVVDSVDAPVNVLLPPNGPTVAALADAGVKRISVGGSFFYVGLDAVVEAATELREQGTSGYTARVSSGRKAAGAAFG